MDRDIAHEIKNSICFVSANLNSLGEYLKDMKKLIQKYKELNYHTPFTKGETRNYLNKKQEVENLEREIDIDFIFEDSAKVIEESLEGAEMLIKIVNDLKGGSRAK